MNVFWVFCPTFPSYTAAAMYAIEEFQKPKNKKEVFVKHYDHSCKKVVTRRFFIHGDEYQFFSEIV